MFINQHNGKGVINEGSQWFYVNYKNAERILRDVYQSYQKLYEGARKQAIYLVQNLV